VHPDRQPQAPGEQVAGAQQDPGLQRDRDRTEDGGLRVAEVGGTEERRGDGQRPPGPHPPFDEAQHDTSDEDLLGESGDDAGLEAGEDPRAPADVHHVIGTEQGQDRDDGAHEQRSHGQADQELAQCRPGLIALPRNRASSFRIRIFTNAPPILIYMKSRLGIPTCFL